MTRATSMAARDGWLPELMLEFFGPRRRGSELLLGVSWADQDSTTATRAACSTQASRELTDLPAWAGTTYHVEVGGEHYLPYWTTGDAGDRTTVYRLDGSNDPTPLFSFDASWYGFNRLR